jgi:MoaA/NifB/PqqE/SkfB family radical SAM enzyme
MAAMSIAGAMAQFPDVLLRGRFSYFPDGMPFVSKGLSFRRRLNLILCGIEFALRNPKLLSFPPVIQIEPTNTCNLKCPLCPTGVGTMKRKKGFMSMKTFQAIIDELGDTLITVILYGWGEPFLNKDLSKMIRVCKMRNILTATSTNGNSIQTIKNALDIVDSGLTGLIIAMDGSNQEIYKKYRKSGDFEKAIRSVSLIEEAKERRNSEYPYTNVRLVVTRDNLHDIPEMKKLAEKLGVNMFSYKSVGCLSSSNEFKNYEPVEDSKCRYEYNGAHRIPKPFFKCSYPFRQPTFFWDGTIVGCEFDYDLTASWGKIGEDNFKKIWNSSRAVKLRNTIRRERRDILPSFCSLCPYQDRVQNSCILSCKELRSPSD